MRIALPLVLAAGCIPQPEPSPPDPYDYGGGGWTDPGGDPVYGCQQNSECGTQVCARNGECYPAASIRLVSTTWTVDGEVASAATCAGHPDLFIHFAIPSGDSFGFAPVPCRNGKFTIDKIATSYTRVELGIMGASSGNTATISSDGTAVIDLR